MSTFIEDCLNGKATAKDVYDYVDKWHSSNSKLSLHNFLGITTQEYVQWVKDENILDDLISKYNKLKNNKPNKFNPEESGFDKIVNSIEGNDFVKAALIYLKSENENLKKELDELKLKNIEFNNEIQLLQNYKQDKPRNY